MNQQQQRPVTYGDVFPSAQADGGLLAAQPVTMEDASLMQCAEALAFGKTQKGGVASAMQSAASKNVEAGLVEREAHSLVAEYGMSVTETAVPGAVLDISYVAGQPVHGSAKPTPTDPAIAALDAVTIGEALEAAAVGAGDRPVDSSDARAIESAEARATGVSKPVQGGVAAIAQSAADLNKQATNSSDQTTLSDILTDATVALPADKVVTHEDAKKILQAEIRGKPQSEGIAEAGIGAAMVAAADVNEKLGLIPPASAPALEDKRQDSEQGMLEDAEEVNRYYPVSKQPETMFRPETEGATPPNSASSEDQILNVDPPTEEEKTPLVSESNSEQFSTQSSGDQQPDLSFQEPGAAASQTYKA